MPIPTEQISTSNLESAAGNPAIAREDLLKLVEALNEIIATAGTPGGLLILDAEGKIGVDKIAEPVITAAGGQMTGALHLDYPVPTDRAALGAPENELLAIPARTLDAILDANLVGAQTNYLAFSPFADGTNFTNQPTVDTIYIGFAQVPYGDARPAAAADYSWTRLKGVTGPQGPRGPQGPGGGGGQPGG